MKNYVLFSAGESVYAKAKLNNVALETDHVASEASPAFGENSSNFDDRLLLFIFHFSYIFSMSKKIIVP